MLRDSSSTQDRGETQLRKHAVLGQGNSTCVYFTSHASRWTARTHHPPVRSGATEQNLAPPEQVSTEGNTHCLVELCRVSF